MDLDWSDDYYHCRKCSGTIHRHVMDGYCQKCFDQLEGNPKNTLKNPRRCLKCSQIFLSEGPGNRRCENCLRREASYHRETHKVNVNS